MDPSQLSPLGDRVFVRFVKEEQTRHGIILPEISRDRPEVAEVLAVGPGARNEHSGQVVPIPVKVGDRILIARFGGTAVGGMDTDDYAVFREQDILAVVDLSLEEEFADLTEPMA